MKHSIVLLLAFFLNIPAVCQEQRIKLPKPRRREPVTASNKVFLKENIRRNREVLKSGEIYLHIEERKFGGSPTPHEP